MVSSMNGRTKDRVGKRLKRIEGQVRGISRMVDEDRYCIDVLTQVQAIRAALHRVEEEILKDHVQPCVAAAFATGDLDAHRHKVEARVAVVGRTPNTGNTRGWGTEEKET